MPFKIHEMGQVGQLECENILTVHAHGMCHLGTGSHFMATLSAPVCFVDRVCPTRAQLDVTTNNNNTCRYYSCCRKRAQTGANVVAGDDKKSVDMGGVDAQTTDKGGSFKCDDADKEESAVNVDVDADGSEGEWVREGPLLAPDCRVGFPFTVKNWNVYLEKCTLQKELSL
jgi:hypothetical protein